MTKLRELRTTDPTLTVGRKFHTTQSLRRWILNEHFNVEGQLNSHVAPPKEATWKQEPFGAKTQ